MSLFSALEHAVSHHAAAVAAPALLAQAPTGALSLALPLTAVASGALHDAAGNVHSLQAVANHAADHVLANAHHPDPAHQAHANAIVENTKKLAGAGDKAAQHGLNALYQRAAARREIAHFKVHPHTGRIHDDRKGH